MVQARMSSTRLPGKVMEDLLGEPLIVRQIERIRISKNISKLVVATSSCPSDDVLADCLEQNGVEVFRGSLTDVLSRFTKLQKLHRPDHIVRLTADCPLIDFNVIDAVVDLHLNSGSDYTSNVLERTFPRGLDVEIFTSATLDRLNDFELTDDEREHVTLGIYSRPSMFSLSNLANESDFSGLRWTVDTPRDLEFIRWVYEELSQLIPGILMNDVLELVCRHPRLSNLEVAN